MLVDKIAASYAEALLAVANADNSLNETTSDINILVNTLIDSSALKKFLSNPVVSRETKKAVLRELFTEIITEKTLRLLMVLVDSRRISFLQDIGDKFIELYYKEESIAVAKIISCVKLSAAQQKDIAEKLKKITGTKLIKIALRVDPQLIGGFTIEIGSKFIDTSIRGQLKHIRRLLGDL